VRLDALTQELGGKARPQSMTSVPQGVVFLQPGGTLLSQNAGKSLRLWDTLLSYRV
jgi:hypothetical protein